MKQESSSLKQNLQMLKSVVPEEMAEKLSVLLLKISKDAMDNIDEHLKLREKHNLGQIGAIDQKERVQNNLRKCFALIKRNDDYTQFSH